MKNRKTSLKDIAEKVGVSTALVSYVLNNKREGRIGKTVAAKIRAAAESLNYRTNQIARSLKSNKTFTIGLIVSDISNPFFSSLARVIEDEADQHKYTVLFGSSDEDSNKSRKLIDALLDRCVDGFIIAPAEHTEDDIRLLRKLKMPFVLIDRYFADLPTSYVALDNYTAAYQAVEQLAHAGRMRIAMIGIKSTLVNLGERKRGYAAALKKNKLSFSKLLRQELLMPDVTGGCERALETLLQLDHPPDAILFESNTLALQGLRILNARKIRIPEQVAVVAFDESPAFDLFHAPLSYIRQPVLEMGRLATNMLIDTINGNHQSQQVHLKGELVIRASSAIK